MIFDAVQLCERYRSRGLLLDSNLLLLLVAGTGEPRLIGTSRLSTYSTEEYDLLLQLRDYFGNRMATTPHVLTEVSNLLNDIAKKDWKEPCFETFKAILSEMTEVLHPSKDAAARNEFVFLGLTDCALAEAASKFLILSDDARMVAKLGEAGLDAINFTHYRVDLQALV